MTVEKTHLSHPKYRPDIDGLRAIAVLSVVTFHAFPSLIRGGFIGVDIFFVISGYLISTIIFENLNKDTFSFTEFYIRRINRIFPSLIIVLASCFAIGWFFLLADEYKQLGKHMAAGAGFISNFILLTEASYFDNSAETKPLLHLWSLGIEEQFYIVWPLFLMFAWKRKFNILLITALITGATFILNIYGIKQDPVTTFYAPHTRFWELLSGSLLARVYLHKKDTLSNTKDKLDYLLFSAINKGNQKNYRDILSNAASISGLFLLFYGFSQINNALSFPGKWALIPVLGTTLIISAGPKAWINRIILSNRILIWIGLISFPLYLWHWPLLSFARIIESEVPSRSIRLAAVVLSIVLAWLTYKLVEHPLRFGKHSKIKATVLISLMAIVGFTGYATFISNGLPFRSFNKKIASYSDSIKISDRSKECFEIPYAHQKKDAWFCNLGEAQSPVQYFAHGDSHALSLIPALENFAFENKLRIQFTGTSGCPSILGIQSMRGESGIKIHNCKDLNERIFNHVKNSGINSVILINRWTYYTKSLSRPEEFNAIARDPSITADKSSSTKDLSWAIQNTVSRYSSIGVKVIFIEDSPQQIHEPKDVLRKGKGIQSEYLKLSVTTDEHINNQKIVNEMLRSSGAKVINLDDILCPEKICPLADNSKFLYSDDDHLSIDGALFVSRTLSFRLRQ